MRFRRILNPASAFGISTLLFGQSVEPFDRLEPIPAYTLLGYSQTVFQVLIKEQHPDLWMIAKPSFHPEYAIILSRIWSDEIYISFLGTYSDCYVFMVNGVKIPQRQPNPVMHSGGPAPAAPPVVTER